MLSFQRPRRLDIGDPELRAVQPGYQSLPAVVHAYKGILLSTLIRRILTPSAPAWLMERSQTQRLYDPFMGTENRPGVAMGWGWG